uniref:Uncharacterized protein n=1 Tax=Poecilia mexicana TaxID=48701 RepID=A0A3B3WF96_9TELE
GGRLINRYGLLRLINSTHQLGNGTMRELTELRNMVLQNHVVLDFLTASQGGVCKIIGPACCLVLEEVLEILESLSLSTFNSSTILTKYIYIFT